MKTTSYTAKKHYAFVNAPRCNAKTKSNNGNPCRAPVVRGKNRCRMHGGAKGSGGQPHNRNALKHGHTTRENILFRKKIKIALKDAQNSLEFFDV